MGIFVAVDHLRRPGRLSEEEEELYFDVDDWFEAELPNSPFCADGNTIGAVTWFKRATSAGLLARVAPLCDIPWIASSRDVRRAAPLAGPGRRAHHDTGAGRSCG